MSKVYPIKWKKEDYNKLNAAVRKFNRTVRKAAENNENQIYHRYLPELKTYKDVKANIYTRAELNRVISQLNRVGKKGALDMIYTAAGDLTTKYELAETRRQAAIYKRSLTRQLNKLPPLEANLMGSEERREIMAQINELSQLETTTGYGRVKLWQKVQKKGTSDYDFKMQIVFKENFLEALKDNFSNQLNFEKLYMKLSSMDPSEFWNYAQANNLVDFLAAGWYDLDKDKYYTLLVMTGLNYVDYPNGGKAYLKEKFDYKSENGKRQDVRVSYTNADKMDIEYIEY